MSELKQKKESLRAEDVLYFEDECSLSNTATLSYQWSESGKQKQVPQKQADSSRVTLFGAVEPATGKVIVQPADKGNADTFKRFLKKILKENKGLKGKIYIVLDNAKIHHANKLSNFLEVHKDKLELIFLPPYSPDFNPVERVWWLMRKRITHNRYINTMEHRLKCFWKMFSLFQKPNEEITKLCNINFLC